MSKIVKNYDSLSEEQRKWIELYWHLDKMSKKITKTLISLRTHKTL